jgi:hypothetical protein
MNRQISLPDGTDLCDRDQSIARCSVSKGAANEPLPFESEPVVATNISMLATGAFGTGRTFYFNKNVNQDARLLCCLSQAKALLVETDCILKPTEEHRTLKASLQSLATISSHNPLLRF